MTEKPPLVSQPSWQPTNKVSAMTVGGAVATATMTMLERFVAIEFTTGEVGAYSLLFGVLIAYFVRNRAT